MSKKFFGFLAGILGIAALVLFFRESGSAASLLWNASGGGKWLLPLIGVSALIDSVNPCAFSILILTIAFLMSIGRLRSNILKIGSAYIIGIFVVYMMIGLGILETLHLFSTPHFMAKVGALLLVLLGGINLANEFFPSFPVKLRIPSFAHRRIGTLMEQASLGTAFALGALVGLCEFPCTGGPYLMVLGLLHDKATFGSGLGYLLLYNAIFVAPLILILGIASDRSLLERVQSWKKTETRGMRVWGSIAMVALGIVIYLF